MNRPKYVKSGIFEIAVGSLLALLAITACNGGKMQQPKDSEPRFTIRDIPASGWENLAKKHIYFGHQSVGADIINGIRDLMSEHPEIKLNLVETENPEAFSVPIFAHSRIGRNTDPDSKCEAFSRIIDSGVGARVDMAVLKFCYIDVTADTDIQKTASNYSSTLQRLKAKYPNAAFAAMTVPLQSRKTGIRTLIKSVFGVKRIWEYEDNVRRGQFNELLEAKASLIPIFDIARAESTTLAGMRESFGNNSDTDYSLVPAYTSDGGHLNSLGRKVIAEQFLIFLVNLISKSSHANAHS
jgi:hypothetical protein